MKILIVDDQRIVAERVRDIILSSDFPCTEARIAVSAADARERIEEKHYEIMLCDIDMPGENGLSLAVWVQEKDPRLKLIFLTAHEKVAYMKAAISLRCFDYLLQPIERQELLNVLCKAREHILAEEKYRNLIRESREALSMKRELELKEACACLMGDRQKENSLRSVLSELCSGDSSNFHFLPIYLQIIQWGPELSESDGLLIPVMLDNVLGELMQERELPLLTLRLSERNLLLLSCTESASCLSGDSVYQISDRIWKCLKDILKIRCAVYPHSQVPPEELCAAVQQLCAEAGDNITLESGVFWKRKSTAPDYFSFENQAELWQSLLNHNEFDQFSRAIHRYMEKYARKSELSLQFLKKLHACVSMLQLGYIANNNTDLRLIFDEELSYISYSGAFHTTEEFFRAVDMVTDRLRAAAEGDSGSELVKAQKYIAEHLMESVTVSEVAGHVGMSPDYLSRQFKKELGAGLKEYITRQKMQMAKKLLETTTLSITIIAEHVGYDNYSNFSRAFRNCMGKSPGDYRTGRQGENHEN